MAHETFKTTLESAKRFLDDLWNDKDNCVPVSYLEDTVITQNVRMARGMVEGALRMADTVDKPTRHVELEYVKEHTVRGAMGEDAMFPTQYVVRRITGSLAWRPGESLDDAQLSALLEDPSWTFTIR